MEDYLLPLIPLDTVSAAQATYGPSNPYLTIGNLSDVLLYDVELSNICSPAEQPLFKTTMLTYITIFEFVEGLSDDQAAEALRTRVDWKYALHLPLTALPLEPATLCVFRQHVWASKDRQGVFQTLIDHLKDFGLVKSNGKNAITTSHLLQTVCWRNCLVRTTHAMQMAIDDLAVNNSDFLRTRSLPHWYERYSAHTSLKSLDSLQDMQTLWESTSTDIQYLLDKIDKSNNLSLSDLSGIRNLRHVWRWQCQLDSIETRVALKGCAAYRAVGT